MSAAVEHMRLLTHPYTLSIAGTSLGDPIEVGAALAVLLQKRKGEARQAAPALLCITMQLNSGDWQPAYLPRGESCASSTGRLPLPLSAAADGPLALAASKAAVGHAEAGAGLVGFAAAVLCAEGRALPQMLHLG